MCVFDFLSLPVQVKRTEVCNHVDGNEKARAELGKRRIVLCLIYHEVRENIVMSHVALLHLFVTVQLR